MRIHSIFRLFKKLLFLFIVVAVLYALNKGLSDYVFEDDLLKEKLQAVKQGSVDKLPVPPSQNGDESRVFQEPKDPDSNNAPEEKEVKGEEKAPKEEAINREDRKKEVPKKGRIKGWDTKKEALIKEEMEKEDENEDDNEEEDKNEEDVNDEDKNEDDVFQGLEPFPEDDAFPQQLDKLEELGGFIAKKLPLEKYVDVEFPIFEDDVDPDGPGEGGAGAKMEKSRSMDAEQREKFDRGWQANSFNELNSERISVHRSLPDCKSRECKQVEEDFPEDFPSVSVIIIFHDEAWSVLLRSVHSILSRTPEHLLREIILVDDFSRNKFLGVPLEKYFCEYEKVKIVRGKKRQGLTRSRLLGTFVSTAPVLVFLDAHIECFPGWLEPLLARVKENYTRVVFPNIERISPSTFTLKCTHKVAVRGVFRMNDLAFQWDALPPEEKKRRKSYTDAIRSPTMPGGLFAISRLFFEKVGLYDPGLDHWGGENIELSFKAWMCGGSVELVPCSHIGHIFRVRNPISWFKTLGHKNSIRVAEVWMDDYKNYFYERLNYQLSEYGDVSERQALRDRLKCHDFQWYHHNVYPNMLKSKVLNAGEIRSQAAALCIDTLGGLHTGHKRPELYPCTGQGNNEFWILDSTGQISWLTLKLCLVKELPRLDKYCMSGEKQWSYRADKTIVNLPTGLCLTANITDHQFYASACTDNIQQKWEFSKRRSDIHFPT